MKPPLPIIVALVGRHRRRRLVPAPERPAKPDDRHPASISPPTGVCCASTAAQLAQIRTERAPALAQCRWTSPWPPASATTRTPPPGWSP